MRWRNLDGWPAPRKRQRGQRRQYERASLREHEFARPGEHEHARPKSHEHADDGRHEHARAHVRTDEFTDDVERCDRAADVATVGARLCGFSPGAPGRRRVPDGRNVQ
jgi:ABC-type nickel/cobalt efflux system permease component RcnA